MIDKTVEQNQELSNIKEAPIAIFDSGVGGLTVYKKLKALLPNENYLYFGDLKNIPYGEKSKEELIKIADKVFAYFEKQGIKALVMACNTTSANTYDALKDKYSFKIYPVIQSCASVIAQLPIKKIGILATEATIKSGAYGKELKKYNPALETFEMSCPPWVGIVEEKRQKEEKSVACVQSYLGEILENYPDKIILGCTHYPYLLDILGKFVPKDMFIDPAQYFAEFIKTDLEKSELISKSGQGSEKFFVSANPEKFKDAASMFCDLKELPTVIEV